MQFSDSMEMKNSVKEKNESTKNKAARKFEICIVW